MTEDQAKTKMCCGPQVVGMTILATAPAGTVEMTPSAGRCIASDCMAWRGGVAVSAVYEEKKPAEEGWNRAYGPAPHWEKTTAVGYCGLAGRP